MLGSITANLMGEPQAAHCGPWFLFVEHALPLCLAGGDLWDRCLSWRSQRGRHPFHRMRLGDDLIDVIAIDALKHAPLESDTRGLDVCQDHWA